MSKLFKFISPCLILLCLFISCDNGVVQPNLDSSKEITAFIFMNPPAAAQIDPENFTIAIEVPSGTDLSSLVPSFVHTGERVSVNGVDQGSGVSPQDFSSPVVYRVHAEDQSFQDYSVTVTVADISSDAALFTFFGFPELNCTGFIDQSSLTIDCYLPMGSDLSSLAPHFIFQGTQVTVDGTPQESGTTLQDFSAPLVYNIEAQDESVVSYTVEVHSDAQDSKSFTYFGFPDLNAEGIIDDANGSISVIVPRDTDLTRLVPYFTSNGAAVSREGLSCSSGAEVADFYESCTYRVTAQDGSHRDYRVDVRIAGGMWRQEAYIKAPNADAEDYFGIDVSLSGDTLVVGAFGEASSQSTIINGTSASSDNSASQAGAAYIFVRNGTNWQQQAYIKAPNADTSDRFGCAVNLSGDTLVVGAMGEYSSQTTITSGTSASSDNSAISAGAAYIFVRNGTNWQQQAYIKAPNADAWDDFGSAVSLSGDTLVVGAFGEASSQSTITNGTSASGNNSASNAGAAYIFVRNGTNWQQQAYIKAPNADSGDKFGNALYLSGDTLVVGAFVESSSQSTITNGNSASSDNSAGAAGAAYIFVRNGTNWQQQAYIKAPNADASDNFGIDVSLSGDTLVVGAFGEASSQSTITNGNSASSDNSASRAGAAYIFVRNGTNWQQQAYIKAPNAEADDYFGSAVSLSGDTLVVGAIFEASSQSTITNGNSASSDNSASRSGAAYTFVRNGTYWQQQAYIKAPNAEAHDFFGRAISLSGDTLVVGADGEDSSQTTITNGSGASSDNSAQNSGAVYVYRWSETNE